MLIKFMKWFRGYLYVTIKGYSLERFINLCRNHNILIWDLCYGEEGCSFYISVKGFFSLRSIVKKTHTRPIIQKRIGLPFHVQKGKKRKAFVFGALLCIFLVYIMSLFVWDISMEGQEEHTQEMLLKYLKEMDVYPGMKKTDVDCQRIEEAIRTKYTDIGWVSAELKGTKLRLKMVETNMPVPYVVASEPCHLVASHDGTIVSIVTRSGTPMVKKGDVVKKGDILISGIVDIIGDGELLLKKESVIADGDIMLETKYHYKESFLIKYQKKKYTEKRKKIYGFSVFGKKVFFYNPLNPFKSMEKCDIIVSEKILKLNQSFVLPFSVFQKSYNEYIVEEAVYTTEEAKDIALEKLKLYTDKLEEENVIIQKNNVKIKMNQTVCTAEGDLIVWEPVKEQKKINDDEWRIMDNNEPDRDDN